MRLIRKPIQKKGIKDNQKKTLLLLRAFGPENINKRYKFIVKQ